MGIKIKLYIGADNETHKINLSYEKKLVKTLQKYWKGFTLRKGKGYFEGQTEESIEVIIFVLNLVFQDLKNCIDELKAVLVQKEIGYEIETDVNFKTR